MGAPRKQVSDQRERLTRAGRIHGADKVAVSAFPLSAIGPDELLLRVVSSSMCISTYKALSLGSDHKRVPGTLSSDPIVMGHEFAGRHQSRRVGQRHAVHIPAPRSRAWSSICTYAAWRETGSELSRAAAAPDRICARPMSRPPAST